MTGKRIEPKIFAKLKSNPKIKASEPVLRNHISEIRRKNPGITPNAAAHVLAEKIGFSLMRYLNNKDRESLQYVKHTPSTQPNAKTRNRSRKINVKEINVPFGRIFRQAANDNAKIYPYIFILENSLRHLVIEKFKNEGNWWTNKKFVHTDIQDYSKRIQLAESKHKWLPKRGNHPIFYVGLYELFKIVEKNWNPYFKDVFDDYGNLRTWINELVPIRNLLAHNIKTRKQEQQNAVIRTEYVCTTIENSV